MRLILKQYFRIFDYLTKEGLEKDAYNSWSAHLVLISMLSTGVLMWAYAFLACCCISHPAPAIVGFISSFVHLLSPLCLKYFKSVTISVNILLFSGMCHQGTFAFYSGEFMSPITIWFGILPLIGGLCDEKRGTITWGIIAIVTSSCFLILSLKGPPNPSRINELGLLLAQILIAFGWILLSSLLIYFFNTLKNSYMLKLKDNNEKIETLVRILCHDISNPIMVLQYKISKFIEDKSKCTDKELEILSQSTNNIANTIRQVRSWQALSSDKYLLDVMPFDLTLMHDELQEQFEPQLKKKNISLTFSSELKEAFVMIDKDVFFGQVISNLISNAIKFSPENSMVEISYKTNGSFIEMALQDNGIGVPDSILKDVFSPNKKTSRVGTMGEVGSGFGLPIVKTFIELMGGTIRIESREENKSKQIKGYTRVILNLKKHHA